MKMPILVSKVHCQSCDHSAFELQRAPLGSCPFCGQLLSEQDHTLQTDLAYELTIDLENGVPRLVKQEA